MAENDDISEMDMANMNEDEKEKLKQKLNKDNTKDKLIDMYMKLAGDLKSVTDKLKVTEDDKQNLETKLTQSLTDMDKKEKLLQEEKDLSNSLAMKLTSFSPVDEPKPAVLLITDSQMVYSKLSDSDVNWSIIVYETASQCVAQISDNEKDIREHDLVVIMIGREEIISGGDGIKIVSQINRLTSILENIGVPFRVAQILPVKGPKGRMEVNIVNRKVLSTSDWSPLNTFKEFENAIEREIFKEKKVNINEQMLTNSVKHMEKLVGKPEIREKTEKHESDDEVVTEFVPILKKIQAKRIIGKKGLKVQAMQKKFGVHISVIDYKYKQSLKHGAIIKGTKSERNMVKSKMEEVMDTPDSDVEDDKENDDSEVEEKGVKRIKKPNVMSWANKKVKQ